MSGPFLQDVPRRSNRYRTDRALRRTIERLLPADVLEEAGPLIDEMGERSIGEIASLAEQAERNPPRHVPWDAWGRRVDRIDVDPAWLRLVRIGQEAGVVAIPYEDRWGPWARVVQFGLLSIYEPASATADCPLSMSDAAARVLLNEDPALAERYVPLLTRRRDAWTSGQWMTEKQGGSDVGRTGTVARPRDDGTYALHGTKWFTSATTTDIALTLARPDDGEQGSRGLSLFLIELRNPDGGWNGLVVRRLKDKLGTKALPTAEMDLEGTIAVPVGGLGRGVAKIAPMLNITRVHAAFGSIGGMGAGLDIVRDYAGRREAFGKLLADLPVHRGWIARIAATYEAALALGFRAAQLLGRFEGNGDGAALTRVVTPLVKMAVARQGVETASHMVESFGGAGYLEDTGIPRMLRDSQVNSIWEGTTSVMSLDVMRSLAKPEAWEAYLDEVDRAARAYDHPLIDGPRQAVLAAREELKRIDVEERNARRLAWGMALTLQGALLCEAAGWNLQTHGDARMATALALHCADPLVPPDAGLGDPELGALAFER